MTLLQGPTGQFIHKVAAGVLLAAIGFAMVPPARDDIRDQQWHLDFLSIERAHEISTGEGIIVGVIDTGVDGGHPDLVGQLLPGADFSVIGEGDGWEDIDGHGTAMAGLIAANGRASGIAPDALVLPVRNTASGLGSDARTRQAIDWAVDHGASVLCLAFGGPRPSSDVETAIEQAIADDVVVIAAVGNLPDRGLVYPAAYPGVVGAAGVDPNGRHAVGSIESPAAVLAAPAVDVMTTATRNVYPSGYDASGGTSAATAIIAGVAALVRSRFPELSAEEVIYRMTYTADDRGAPGRDDEYGYGIVDPVAALTADVPPLHATPTPSTQIATPGGTTQRTWLVYGAILGAGFVALIVVGIVLGRRRR